MKIKRAISIGLIAVMPLGLAACQDEDNDGLTTDEEAEQLEEGVDQATDEAEQQIEEGAEEPGEG